MFNSTKKTQEKIDLENTVDVYIFNLKCFSTYSEEVSYRSSESFLLNGYCFQNTFTEEWDFALLEAASCLTFIHAVFIDNNQLSCVNEAEKKRNRHF